MASPHNHQKKKTGIRLHKMGGAPFSFPDQSGFPLGSVYLRAKKNKNGHRALQNGGFPSKSHRNKWAQDLPKWTFRGLLRTAKAKRGELQGLQLNNTKPLKTPQLRLPPRPRKSLPYFSGELGLCAAARGPKRHASVAAGRHCLLAQQLRGPKRHAQRYAHALESPVLARSSSRWSDSCRSRIYFSARMHHFTSCAEKFG